MEQHSNARQQVSKRASEKNARANDRMQACNGKRKRNRNCVKRNEKQPCARSSVDSDWTRIIVVVVWTRFRFCWEVACDAHTESCVRGRVERNGQGTTDEPTCRRMGPKEREENKLLNGSLMVLLLQCRCVWTCGRVCACIEWNAQRKRFASLLFTCWIHSRRCSTIFYISFSFVSDDRNNTHSQSHWFPYE